MVFDPIEANRDSWRNRSKRVGVDVRTMKMALSATVDVISTCTLTL
jgi:hypothetical protein